MAINKKITELGTKIIDPDDIFIIADQNDNYQITLGEISGALAGNLPTQGESTYAYFSDFENNVGTITLKEYDAGGNILQKVISDDFSNFKAYLNWDGPGAIDYRGTGYIENQEILVGNTTEAVVGSRNFAGFVDNLDVSNNVPLQLSGEANGKIAIVNLEIAGPAPVAETVRMEAIDRTTSADGRQLFPGDEVDVYAWFDFSNHSKSEEPFEFRIGNPANNLDLLNGTSFSEWNQPWLTNHPLDPTLSGINIKSTVNNVTDSTIEHGISLQCKNRFGKISTVSSLKADQDPLGATDSFGLDIRLSQGIDLYYFSHLVGKAPSVNIIGVEYPGKNPSDAKVTTNVDYDQQAIKAGDSALVENTASDYDTIEYTSPNGELTIENPNTYEQFKKVTYNAGTYNLNTNNFRIRAIKQSLDSVKESCIKIADTPLELDIVNLPAKLRSSPGGQNWNFALRSNQLQLQAPELEIDPSQIPTSSLSRLSTSTGTNNNNFRIRVSDADEKGTFIWQNILAVNLAGVETTTVKAGDENYKIEGFMSRQVSAAFRGFLLGTYPIGTTVTNPNNVTFFSDSSNSNLTFHDLGDGTVLTAGNFDSNINFRGNPGNLAAGLFSIGFLNATQDEFTVNKNGDHIFILDRGIRGLNSSLPVSTGLPGAIDATADVEEI